MKNYGDILREELGEWERAQPISERVIAALPALPFRPDFLHVRERQPGTSWDDAALSFQGLARVTAADLMDVLAPLPVVIAQGQYYSIRPEESITNLSRRVRDKWLETAAIYPVAPFYMTVWGGPGYDLSLVELKWWTKVDGYIVLVNCGLFGDAARHGRRQAFDSRLETGCVFNGNQYKRAGTGTPVSDVTWRQDRVWREIMGPVDAWTNGG